MRKSKLPINLSEKEGDDLRSDSQSEVRSDTGVKRYNLVLPEELFNELQQTATDEHTSVVDLLRRFIKLGLLAIQISRNPDAALIVREGSREREILLL